MHHELSTIPGLITVTRQYMSTIVFKAISFNVCGPLLHLMRKKQLSCIVCMY
jgi:hypothetical protein